MDPNENPPVQSVLLEIWDSNYPLAYWDNRLKKINSYNPQDKMEALFTLLQLADTYVHVLSAKLRNPYEPWYMVTEETYRDDIDATFEVFDVSEGVDDEPFADLSLFDGDAEDLIGFNFNEDWTDDLEPLDALAVELLGCPVEIDEEQHDLEYLDDRDDYIALVNGVVDFWRRHVPFLNDLKHGFRLLPFNWEAFKALNEAGFFRGPDFAWEEKEEEFQKTKENHIYFWRLEIDKSIKEEPDEDLEPGETLKVGTRLVVYRIEFDKCLLFAQITFRLLCNLINRRGEFEVLEILKELPEADIEPAAEDGMGSVQMFEPFISGDLVFGLEE